MIPQDEQKGGQNTYKANLRNEVSIRGFGSIWHIPGDPEGHAHVEDCANAQQRPDKPWSLTYARLWGCMQAGSEG